MDFVVGLKWVMRWSPTRVRVVDSNLIQHYLLHLNNCTLKENKKIPPSMNDSDIFFVSFPLLSLDFSMNFRGLFPLFPSSARD